jgi:hypothetical protein
MNTVIIIGKGWVKVAEYEYLIPLQEGNIVEHNGIEYKVYAVCLNIDKFQYEILIEEP